MQPAHGGELKKDTAPADGFADMAKMRGNETCLFPRETSYIHADGNTSIQQTFREPTYYVPGPVPGAREDS